MKKIEYSTFIDEETSKVFDELSAQAGRSRTKQLEQLVLKAVEEFKRAKSNLYA